MVINHFWPFTWFWLDHVELLNWAVSARAGDKRFLGLAPPLWWSSRSRFNVWKIDYWDLLNTPPPPIIYVPCTRLWHLPETFVCLLSKMHKQSRHAPVQTCTSSLPRTNKSKNNRDYHSRKYFMNRNKKFGGCFSIGMPNHSRHHPNSDQHGWSELWTGPN